MASTDLYGYDVALATDEANTAWRDLNLAFLSHGATTADHLGTLLKEAPEFAIAEACRGIFSLLMGRRELVATAAEALTKAKSITAAHGSDTRTDAYIHALEAYLGGQLARAATIFDTLTKTHPRDAMAIKLAHAIKFVLGDAAGMRTSLEAVMPQFRGTSATDGYIHGCYAFALEETGDQRAAEIAGKHALDLVSDDAWGLHAVAHVYDMTARAKEGVSWLESRTDAWAHCNNFRYHVYWHLALFYLDTGAYSEVLRLYDLEIRQDKTDDYRDISNAASLLSRLELEGVDIGDRWDELASVSEHRVDDGCVVFADLHYMLSLLGGDRTDATKQLLHRMRADAQRSGGDMDRVTEHPGLNAASGLVAFRDANYTAAYANLRAARKSMPTVGGSHAQRDVFERITIEAAIRAGAFEDARHLVDERAKMRGGVDGYTTTRMAALDELLTTPVAVAS